MQITAKRRDERLLNKRLSDSGIPKVNLEELFKVSASLSENSDWEETSDGAVPKESL